MNTKDLNQIGVPQGEAMKRAHAFIVACRDSGGGMWQLEGEIGAIVGNPSAFLGDPMREEFARSLYVPAFKQRETLAPWARWGSGLEPEAVQQMANACALPVSVAGAL